MPEITTPTAPPAPPAPTPPAQEVPLELLETQRQIKAKQVGDLGMPKLKGASLAEAIESLQTTIQKKKILPNDKAADLERDNTVERLRQLWNAPARHTQRIIRPDSPREWFEACEKIISRLGTGFTVALVGKRGPGKTQLAVEAMRESTRVLRAAYYCTAMDYFMRIKDSYHPNQAESQRGAQIFFVTWKLLVVDEMNVRSDSAWEDNMLSDLIGKRYNGMLDTILISNETAEEFYKSVGPSICDRLSETGGIIECTWRSFRE